MSFSHSDKLPDAFSLLTCSNLHSNTRAGEAQLNSNYTVSPITVSQVQRGCGNKPPPFPLVETTISSVQAAFSSGSLNCSQLVQSYVQARLPSLIIEPQVLLLEAIKIDRGEISIALVAPYEPVLTHAALLEGLHCLNFSLVDKAVRSSLAVALRVCIAVVALLFARLVAKASQVRFEKLCVPVENSSL